VVINFSIYSNNVTHTTLVHGNHIIYCIIIYQVTCYLAKHYILSVDLVIRSVKDIYVRITHSQHETKPNTGGKDGTARIRASLFLMQFMLVCTGLTENVTFL